MSDIQLVFPNIERLSLRGKLHALNVEVSHPSISLCAAQCSVLKSNPTPETHRRHLSLSPLAVSVRGRRKAPTPRPFPRWDDIAPRYRSRTRRQRRRPFAEGDETRTNAPVEAHDELSLQGTSRQCSEPAVGPKTEQPIGVRLSLQQGYRRFASVHSLRANQARGSAYASQYRAGVRLGSQGRERRAW